jgi:hypothetical protein
MESVKSVFMVLLSLCLALWIGVGAAAAGAPGEIMPAAQAQTPTMEAVAQALLIAGFMATVANRLVTGLVTPLFDKMKLDHFYLIYVAWAIGGILVWVTHVNIFEGMAPDPLTGQILTAIVAGGGANMLHDLFNNRAGPAKANSTS